jgi:hypothetical protein
MVQEKKLSSQLKLVIIVAWFVIFYFLMWFFGGACTGFFSEGACLSSGAISFFKEIPILGLFIPFGTWVSIMYFFAPLVGFLTAYFGYKSYNDYFETKQAFSIVVPILLLIVLFGGYVINLGWYYGNVAQVNNSQTLDVGLYFCFDEAKCESIVNTLNAELQQNPGVNGKITQLIAINYWHELRKTIFLTFIFGAIAAWIPLFIFNLIENKKNS